MISIVNFKWLIQINDLNQNNSDNIVIKITKSRIVGDVDILIALYKKIFIFQIKTEFYYAQWYLVEYCELKIKKRTKNL